MEKYKERAQKMIQKRSLNRLLELQSAHLPFSYKTSEGCWDFGLSKKGKGAVNRML